MNDFESLVGLNLIPQIGSARLETLLGYFGRPQEIFKSGRGVLDRLLGCRISEGIVSFDRRRLEKDLAQAREAGLEIFTLLDPEYPRNLKEIPSAPIVLYVRGKINASDRISLGIIGSRRASFYGLSCADKFAAELSRNNLTIVSGLARGVDTCAHRGALRAGGRTIAVMGSGFNHIYPPENRSLSDEISRNGAVVSEFPMETLPLAQNFPRRNRLISGLSLGVLVTEAPRNSGALITVDFALEQGREVFAIPGRIDTSSSGGTNELLKQGARLVTCSQDIIEELEMDDAVRILPPAPEAKENILCAKEAGMIYNCIGDKAVTVDELIGKTSFPAGMVLGLVLGLRLKGLVRELPGKQFIRS